MNHSLNIFAVILCKSRWIIIFLLTLSFLCFPFHSRPKKHAKNPGEGVNNWLIWKRLFIIVIKKLYKLTAIKVISSNRKKLITLTRFNRFLETSEWGTKARMWINLLTTLMNLLQCEMNAPICGTKVSSASCSTAHSCHADEQTWANPKPYIVVARFSASKSETYSRSDIESSVRRIIFNNIPTEIIACCAASMIFN